jgi:HEAT repeat protein
LVEWREKPGMKKITGGSPDDNFIKAMKMLANTVLEDRDPLARKHALYLIGISRNPGCIPILIQGLRDPEKAVRAQTVHALISIGQTASSALIGLLKDPDWKVRYRAAEALGMVGGENLAPALITLLQDDKDHVRYIAAKSLGMIRSPEAKDPLRACLNDENQYVRAMALSALSGIGAMENKSINQ